MWLHKEYRKRVVSQEKDLSDRGKWLIHGVIIMFMASLILICLNVQNGEYVDALEKFLNSFFTEKFYLSIFGLKMRGYARKNPV